MKKVITLLVLIALGTGLQAQNINWTASRLTVEVPNKSPQVRYTKTKFTTNKFDQSLIIESDVSTKLRLTFVEVTRYKGEIFFRYTDSNGADIIVTVIKDKLLIGYGDLVFIYDNPQYK